MDLNMTISNLIDEVSGSKEPLSTINNKIGSTLVRSLNQGVIDPKLGRVMDGIHYGILENVVVERLGHGLSDEQKLQLHQVVMLANNPVKEESDITNLNAKIDSIAPVSSTSKHI